MTGSIQPIRGKYYAMLNLKDEHGKRKQKTISLNLDAVPGNKKKAESALRKLLVKYERDNMEVCKGDTLFCDYIMTWLEESKPRIEQASYESYLCMIEKHIFPYFNKLGVNLRDLTYQDVQKYYNQKRDDKDNPLSANTLKKHHAVINQTLKKALRNDLIPHNPADRVTLPRIKKYVGSFLSVEDGQRLLDVVADTPMEAVIMLGMMYGLRRSEIAGLKWSAVDFENDVISITHTVVRIKTVTAKDRAKNKSSYRTLPLNPEMKDFLLRLRDRQRDDKEKLGTLYNDTEYVCRWANGKPIPCAHISQAFKRLLIKHDLPLIRLHDLRHTCASLMLKAGCNMKEMSDWLGHVDIGTTMNIYAHLDVEAKKGTANALGSIFGSKSVKQSVKQEQKILNFPAENNKEDKSRAVAN